MCYCKIDFVAGTAGSNDGASGEAARPGRAGAVHLMMQMHSLEASMAKEDFDFHTLYLIPGSKSVPAGSDGD